jgi:hypothetical protein
MYAISSEKDALRIELLQVRLVEMILFEPIHQASSHWEFQEQNYRH